MLKKLWLSLLIFSMMLPFCACNTNEVPQASSQSSTETEIQVTTGNEYSNCSPIGPSNGSFYRLSDYQAYLESKNCELPMLSDPKYLEAFGTVNRVNVWTLNSSDDFYVEYAYTYLENDSRDDCRVQIYSMNRFYSRFGYLLETGFVDDADMCELLTENLDLHWMRTTETEEDYAELLAKYYPNGAVPLRYRLSDQVFACHGKHQFQGFVFIFDDCVVRIQFYYALPSYGDIICPTLKGLSFKSTSKATAEKLYNLWKNALK